jgi:hypothetical protein
MEYKVIGTIEDFESIKDDWERIENLSPITSYFSTFRYNYTWWKAYQDCKDLKLLIIVIYHNKENVGIAPLKIRKDKRRFYSRNILEFLGQGDYSDFLIDISKNIDPRKIIGDIFTIINMKDSMWDEIDLTHISQYTLLANYLFTSKYNENFLYLIEVPFIDFSKYYSFEDYTKAFLPKKIKQYLNRFQRQVDYKVVVTNKNVLGKISGVHIAEKEYLRAKGLIQRHSFFEDEYSRIFFNLLYANNSNVITYLLMDTKNNNDVICYYTGYVYKKVFHSYNTAYNPLYKNLAVGKIFNYLIFENNQIDKRWDIFDMGTGRYEWKFEWTNAFNLLYKLQISKPINNKFISYLSKCEEVVSTVLRVIRS